MNRLTPFTIKRFDNCNTCSASALGSSYLVLPFQLLPEKLQHIFCSVFHHDSKCHARVLLFQTGMLSSGNKQLYRLHLPLTDMSKDGVFQALVLVPTYPSARTGLLFHNPERFLLIASKQCMVS